LVAYKSDQVHNRIRPVIVFSRFSDLFL